MTLKTLPSKISPTENFYFKRLLRSIWICREYEEYNQPKDSVVPATRARGRLRPLEQQGVGIGTCQISATGVSAVRYHTLLGS